MNQVLAEIGSLLAASASSAASSKLGTNCAGADSVPRVSGAMFLPVVVVVVMIDMARA